MKNRLYLVLLVICFGASSCISTRVTSLVDPQYRDSSYARILIVGNYKQIEMTQMMETQMVNDLRDSGIFAIANSELLPPLRKYSDAEISEVYAKFALDACLIISPLEEKTENFYHPGWTSVNNRVNVNHGFSNPRLQTTTVTTSVNQTGGSYEKHNYVDTRAELRDIRTGYLVCRAETKSEQTTYNTSTQPFNESVVRSISEKMVGELNKNKLLRRK